MRWVLAVLIACALVACGGDDEPSQSVSLGGRTTTLSDEADGSASAAAQQLILADMQGDGGAAWALIHPTQQAALSQAAFTECWGDGVDLTWESIDIERESDQVVAVDGLGTLNVVRTHASYMALVPLQATHDWAEVDGQWRWVVSQQQYETLLAGRCPFL